MQLKIQDYQPTKSLGMEGKEPLSDDFRLAQKARVQLNQAQQLQREGNNDLRRALHIADRPKLVFRGFLKPLEAVRRLRLSSSKRNDIMITIVMNLMGSSRFRL